VQKRLSHGLQMQGNDTYSRSIDTWSGGLQGSSDYLTGAGSAVDYWDIDFERGRSSFDVPHNFVFDAVYLLPAGDHLTGLKAALAKGWQVAGIVSVSSGLPFLFNRAHLNPPSSPLLFRSDGTRIAGAERITSLATPARQLQLGMKILF